jgi:hypothetical protein
MTQEKKEPTRCQNRLLCLSLKKFWKFVIFSCLDRYSVSSFTHKCCTTMKNTAAYFAIASITMKESSLEEFTLPEHYEGLKF